MKQTGGKNLPQVDHNENLACQKDIYATTPCEIQKLIGQGAVSSLISLGLSSY